MVNQLLVDRLKDLATDIRRRDLEMVHRARLGHIGGDLSAIDILTALYFAVLKVDPAAPAWPERDRFILSKGHCAGALYATLAEAGFIELDELSTYMQPRSRLGGHPDRTKMPGVETNTGPLGHGLPVAVGCALAAKMDGAAWRTFVLTGDGELQEGSNWEAALPAAHYRLDNLTVVVDRNGLLRLPRHGRPLPAHRPDDDHVRRQGGGVCQYRGHLQRAVAPIYADADQLVAHDR